MPAVEREDRPSLAEPRPRPARQRAGRRSLVALAILLAATAAIRSPGLNRPLLGNFATKNAVNGMLARNWALGRAPAWLPTLDCLADGRRSLHLLEIPVGSYAAGACWRLLGGSLDVWGRLVSVAFSTASVALMFLLVRRWHGSTAAWAAAVALALSPVSIIYGQGFMIEPSLVFFTLAALWCWTRWLEQRRWPALAGAAAALALLLLTKIYMLVLLLPLAAMLVRGNSVTLSEAKGLGRGRGRFFAALRMTDVALGTTRVTRMTRGTLIVSALALLAAIVPAAAWLAHVWRLSDPAGPDAASIYYSLRHSADAHGFPHPLLSTSGFYLKAIRDLGGMALTPIGLALAAVGVFHCGARRHWAWLLSMAVLVVVMPRKFHEMNYYYLVILPPLCVLAGLGWQVIAERFKPSPRWAVIVLIAGACLALRLAWKPAFVTPEEDRSVVAAAAAARELTSPDEPVATLHGTTLDLLYYCDRPGWALSCEKSDLAERLAQCRQQGARYLVVAGVERLDGRAQQTVGALEIIQRGDDYLIARLP